jgi:ribosomal peptide maturation radical SAM protein 1
MHDGKSSVLLIAMPFAGIAIPSIQLPILEGYLKEREINITTKHLYLKAAEFYGVNNYHHLITRPNESYTAQMVFPQYVFPEHWNKNQYSFKDYFKKIVAGHAELQKNFTFEEYIERTDRFYTWIIENVNWKDYDIIGFTLNYGQFLPSLAIAKKIKEIAPEKKIVFGGSRTVGELGIRVLRTFDYVDFIVSGEGEEALYLLAFNISDLPSIPNLIYRNNGEIIWNKSDKVIDLNTLPFLNFDDFYNDLWSTNDDVTQYYLYHGRLPVEICRGCWWNKCTFCNYNVQHPCYREKNVKRIIDEIKYLSDKYTMLNFQIIGNTLPKRDYRLFLEEIIKLGRDFNFFTETRAGQLKSEDYRLMKEAGFTNIQTGIESFSQSYLKKINKGVRVIDNIAALKFCKECGIKNEYNIIVDYPNEEKIDFEETKRNIQFIKHYLDPPQINKLLVGFGSFIYQHPELFNIDKLEYTDIDKIIYPMDILEKGISFYYSFKKKEDLGENNWAELVEEWKTNQGQIQEMIN